MLGSYLFGSTEPVDEPSGPQPASDDAKTSEREDGPASLELFSWSNRTADVLAKAVLAPVNVADRRSIRSLAYMRVLVLACLNTGNSNLLDQLAAEVLAGKEQLSQASKDLAAAARQIQALARGRFARNDFKTRMKKAISTLKGLYHNSLAQNSCLVFGSLNADLRAVCHGILPEVNGSSATGTFRQIAGGKGANEAVAIARLGVKTYLQGKVGCDSLGVGMLAHLQEMGFGLLDTSGVTQDKTAMTGVAVQVRSKSEEERMTVVCGGANNALDDADVQLAKTLILSVDRAGAIGANVELLLLQLEVSVGPMLEGEPQSSNQPAECILCTAH